MKNDWDIAIAGGTLLTMSDEMDIIEDALIGVRNGSICFVGENGQPDSDNSRRQAKDTIDAAGCIVMPGLINTHTHLPMVCFRGMADDNPNPIRNSVMAAAERFVGRWQPHAPMITPAFFCHAPYTRSPETLINVKKAAREAGILANYENIVKFYIQLLKNSSS